MTRDLYSNLTATQILAPAVYDADKNAAAVDLLPCRTPASDPGQDRAGTPSGALRRTMRRRSRWRLTRVVSRRFSRPPIRPTSTRSWTTSAAGAN